MNRSQGNLQDAFLNSARRESVGVTVYLVSGVQLRGVIKAFDAFTVLLESQGRPAQMVYKHAIASVAPIRAVVVDGGPRWDDTTSAVRNGHEVGGVSGDGLEPVEREVPVAP
jgi:host factor-I protein